VKRSGGIDTVLADQSIATGEVTLGIRFIDTRCALEFTIQSVTTEFTVTSTRELSSAVAGGFLGVWVGMYASGNGRASAAVADFDWFEYRNLDDEQ
jgi:xylan 1,4-beta-xylosidase